VRVTFPVRLVRYDGSEWDGWAADVSPFGIRVRTNAALSAGTAANLSFTLPDGKGPLRVMSLHVRADDDGHAFYFMNLTAVDFERLTDFARRLPT
jgi:hypothetical protein